MIRGYDSAPASEPKLCMGIPMELFHFFKKLVLLTKKVNK